MRLVHFDNCKFAALCKNHPFIQSVFGHSVSQSVSQSVIVNRIKLLKNAAFKNSMQMQTVIAIYFSVFF